MVEILLFFLSVKLCTHVHVHTMFAIDSRVLVIRLIIQWPFFAGVKMFLMWQI